MMPSSLTGGTCYESVSLSIEAIMKIDTNWGNGYGSTQELWLHVQNEQRFNNWSFIGQFNRASCALIGN